MNEKAIVAALHAAGILSPTEASGDNAVALVMARIAELKQPAPMIRAATLLEGEPIKSANAAAVTAKDAEITALRGELDAAKAEKADAAVDAAVKAGRIAPKDEVSRKFWADAIRRDGEAVKALNAIPVNPALKATATGSQEKPSANPDKEGAFYEAVTARARVIEKTTGVTFGTAFSQAEAEIKATQA